jgi:hypothetical protein
MNDLLNDVPLATVCHVAQAEPITVRKWIDRAVIPRPPIISGKRRFRPRDVFRVVFLRHLSPFVRPAAATYWLTELAGAAVRYANTCRVEDNRIIADDGWFALLWVGKEGSIVSLQDLVFPVEQKDLPQTSIILNAGNVTQTALRRALERKQARA